MAFPAIIASIASAAMSKNQADNAAEQNRQANPYGGGLQGASTQGTGKVEGPTKSDLSVKQSTQTQQKGGLLDGLSDENLKNSNQVGKYYSPGSNTNGQGSQPTGIEPKKESKPKGSGGKLSKEDWMSMVKGLVNSVNSVGDQVTPIKADNYGAPMVSDERLKNRERLERIFQGDGAIDAFSKIDAFVYNYNDKAQKMYGGQKGVDNSPHFGPMAQDLAKNPVTSGTVHKDENGFLNVDTRQLSLTNTAMISQLARKVQELEERLGGR